MSGLSTWMRNFWLPMLGYNPRIHLMSKGWIGLGFEFEEDDGNILAMQWWLNSSLLSLKAWSHLFYLVIERLEVNLVWVKLPSLQLAWWIVNFLPTLGNRLGGLFTIDEEMKISLKRIVAKILVNLKVFHGLYDSIDLVVGNKRHLQILDCVTLTFHYAHYHKECHLFEDYTQSKLKWKWVAKNLLKNIDSPIPQVRVVKLKETHRGFEILSALVIYK